MKLFLLLIGMVLILEGLPYAAAPEAMREWLEKLGTTNPSTLRVIGLISMGIGFLICYLVQGVGLFN